MRRSRHTARRVTLMLLFALPSSAGLRAAAASPKPETPSPAASAHRLQYEQLRDAYLAKFKPLFTESATAWWEANTTGDKEAFKRKERAETALVELHSDKEMFARVKALKQNWTDADPVAARELDVMYRKFLPGQADPDLQKRIVALETEVEEIFNTHRSPVGGREITENDVRQILSDSKDSRECEEAWKGYMLVGKKIDPKLRELVSLRNELARKLGFANYYEMKLTLDEVDQDELLKLFDELDELTRDPFAQVKREIDVAASRRFGLPPAELRPWHFSDLFFQAPPKMEGPDLDEVYAGRDLLAMAGAYYAELGLPADDILARSDLYEKPGKSPHAFSISLDRAQDIRVLCNLKRNLYWADTLIHELGHAVYDKFVAADVPFILHEASHSITTEGYAMMMGAMVKNADFLSSVLKMPPEKAAPYVAAARKSLRAEKLIFSRWAQVMVRFEHGMYSKPDQDLGKLWWDLKKKYQLLNPPETVSRPDYAAKIHVVTAPVYYHSYMMGDLFACQVHHHIATKVLGLSNPLATSFAGQRKVGDYLKKEIFGPGNLYSWNELTRRATGEPLTARYFAAQYVRQ